MPRNLMIQKGQKLITSAYKTTVKKPIKGFKYINQFGTKYSKTEFNIGADDITKIKFRNKFYGLHVFNPEQFRFYKKQN